MTTPLNNLQIPDKSIMDIWGRQTYLGNSFSVPQPGFVTADTTEVPALYIANASDSGKSLFLTCLKAQTDDETTVIRTYLNPTVSTPGGTTTPVNLRSGVATTSIADCHLTPTVALAAVKQVRRLVFSQTGAFYDVSGAAKAIQLYDSPNVGYYFWASVTGGGGNVQTDPGLAGTGVEVVLANGDTAAQVATKFHAEIDAITAHFSATNTPAGTVTATNETAGADLVADSVTGSAAALTILTPGADLGAGDQVETAVTTATSKASFGLIIVDPGTSFLLTVQPATGTPTVYIQTEWFEI